MFGGFERSVPIPNGTNTEDIAAEFENGVLTIRVPKKSEVAAHQVPIKEVSMPKA